MSSGKALADPSQHAGKKRRAAGWHVLCAGGGCGYWAAGTQGSINLRIGTNTPLLIDGAAAKRMASAEFCCIPGDSRTSSH